MASLQKAIAQLMESRAERPPQRIDPPALAALLAALDGRIAASDREHAAAFARELLGKAPELLEANDPAQLAEMTASAFAFVRDRANAAVRVRVIEPQGGREGTASPFTVVETIAGDRPFIVDTLRDEITAEGGEIRTLLHPIFGIERTPEGRIVRLGAPDDFPARESFCHVEVASLSAGAALQQRLTERLEQIVAVTDDYPAMRRRVAETATELRRTVPPPPWDAEREDVAALLDWLGQRSFVYLGYREYDVRGAPGSREASVRPARGLGLLRDDAHSAYRTAARLPPELEQRLDRPPLWLVSKTRATSPIHRAAPMDDIVVKEVSADGAVIGAVRLVGLFTAKAYAEPPSELPVLRGRLAALLSREGALEGSYDERELVELFNSVPIEELLASTVDDIDRTLRAIRAADGRDGIEVISRPDAWRAGLLVTVLIPRARFSTGLHARVVDTLRRELRATVQRDHLALDDRPVVRLHAWCAVAAEVLARPPIELVRRALNALLRTWDDELREALVQSGDARDADRLARRYASAFPAAYKASTPIADAVRDVGCLDALAATGQVQIEMIASPAAAAGAQRGCTLKLYLGKESLVLSEFVPILEHFGMRVLGQAVVELAPSLSEPAVIHSFAVEASGGDLAASAPRVIAALHAIRGGILESDRLNALITAAGLDWRGVDLLRAYVEHAAQVGLATRPLLIDALTANPASAAALYGWFAAAFDPLASALGAAERSAGAIPEARDRFFASLDSVPSLAHDRVLRGMGETVGATVRTNFYSGAAAIALKLDGGGPSAAAPHAIIETWVHSAQMAGVHLRAGRVARGGIRASERPDDFRSEILGLLRTQVVKNAVIVPVGAKGGFVVKGPPRAAGADPARTEAAYRMFIDALLSITDNVENGRIVPPSGQLVYDGGDPYLVVAPDTGTARFSDTANRVAAERGFWLGDAFASGGEHGYDHKRLGITARGAWECARQHFRELGRDLDRETVTAVGIGDMSGDVFGNGMLRSRHLRLLAAFNHREIFIDPDPDPEVAYRERERLARLPYSSWSDYAPTSLSRGGGVYARGAKAIPLAPEARTLLGIDAPTASGEQVIRHILCLRVDLLWNGGIGTYVKAHDERHADAEDPENDAVRVDAVDLRAAVVVEGGNLGLTPRARVEYALAGGQINTDAIDNSAGVDLSDHEVTLKIALQPLLARGELSFAARHALLAELTEPVCDAVLAHNRAQTAVLAVDQWRSRTQLPAFRDLIGILQGEAGLDRALAELPTREGLRARRGAYLGLTRPELAMLMAHTKLDLRHRIVQSRLYDEPALDDRLRGYFPRLFADRFPAAVASHPLRGEIIAVELANELIDSMGIAFLVRAVRDSGCDVLDVVRAWVASAAILDAAALRAELDAARDRLSAESERRVAVDFAGALERATLWLLQTQPTPLSAAALIERFRAPVTALLAAWPETLLPAQRAGYAAGQSALRNAGVPATLADRLARATDIDRALEIVHIGHAAHVSAALAAAAYLHAEILVDLSWIRGVLRDLLPAEDRWEPRAAAALAEELLDLRRRLTLQVLAQRNGDAPIDACVGAFIAGHREQLDAVTALIDDLKAAPQPTLPALLVILHEIGRLARAPEADRTW